MRIDILVSTVVLFTGACASDHRVPRAGTIRDSLNAAAGTPADVAITQFAPGDWTELFVFGPYSSSEVIARCVGSRVDDAGIASRDDIDLFIFRFADGATASRAVPRGTPSFEAGAWNAAYGRAATFRLVRSPLGPWTTLVPADGLTSRCSSRAI
jgi:hypothetical protein